MSPIFRAVIIFALFAVILAQNSFGRDIHVHGKSGDDRSSGHSAENIVHATGPVRTISRAVELAEGGDRIVLDPEGGPYCESISLVGKMHSGAFDLPFIIEGNGAVLDGRESLPTEVWKHLENDIYRFQATMPQTDWSYLALYDGDMMLKRISVEPSVDELPALEPHSWCLFQGFIYFRTEKNRSPIFDDDYSLSYSAKRAGVTLAQVQDVRIHDLNVLGFQIDGISATNGAINVVLDNVTSRLNGRSGLCIGGASVLAAGYGTFEGNQTCQVLALPFSKTRLFDCTVSKDGIEKSTDAELVIETEK